MQLTPFKKTSPRATVHNKVHLGHAYEPRPDSCTTMCQRGVEAEQFSQQFHERCNGIARVAAACGTARQRYSTAAES